MEDFINPGKDCKCFICQCLLSIFPIYLHSNGAICGRCLIPKNIQNEAVRNISYEAIAKLTKFPCRFKSYGCLEKVIPSKMKLHENSCSYRQISCPLLNENCEWKGDLEHLHSHYNTSHQNYFLEDAKFEVDLINNYEESYLFFYGEQLFILQISFEHKEQLFYYTLIYLGIEEDMKNYSYKIIFSKNFSKNSLSFTTSTINTELKKYFDKETAQKISVEELKEKLNDPISVLCSVEIFKNSNESATNKVPIISLIEENEMESKLMTVLECPICEEYMVPPIYQCVIGHTICNICKEQLTECPKCRNKIENTRNFQLEDMTSHVDYPCKYSHFGCKTTCNLNNIKDHESSCKFGPYACPFSGLFSCEWKGLLENLMSHVEECHCENISELPMICYVDGDCDEEDYFVKQVFNQIFLICFKSSGGSYKWNVQFYGPKEDAQNYYYELDIKDNSKQNRRMFLKQPCNPLTEFKNIFENTQILEIHKQLLKPLIREGDLMYSCRIVPATLDDQYF